VTLLTACSLPRQAATATQSKVNSEEPSAQPVESTDTPVPPAVTGKALLIDANEGKTPDGQVIQSTVNELASTSGLAVEIHPSLSPSELKPEVKVVVLLSQPPNLAELVSAQSQAQFALIAPGEQEASNNLSVIRLRPELQAFMAGYLAEILAPDWRAAGLLPDDPSSGAVVSEAFNNGAHYLCGVCASVGAPVLRFPQTLALPAGSLATGVQAALEDLIHKDIHVMYVSPELSNADMLGYLVGKSLILVGGQTPPDEIRKSWAATVRLDPQATLRDMWPDLVAGKGGKRVDSPLLVTDIQPELFSVGRQRLVDETLQDLQAGLIDPMSVP
jgi:hypothetical protein